MPLFQRNDPFAALTAYKPTGLGWDDASYPIGRIWLKDMGFGRYTGGITASVESLFNLYSTALSAPGATFYVDVTSGNDSNNGLTAGAAFKSIGKAISSANTANVPTKIFIKAGNYYRTMTPAFNVSSGQGNLIPTVDLALIATHGRVLIGTFEDVTRFPDGFDPEVGYTNIYSSTATASNGGTDGFDRVLDLNNLNEFGNYVELTYVADKTACNNTPNSWTSEISGSQHKIYIHRRDKKEVVIQGDPVNTPNTRIFRGGSFTYNFRQTNDCSVYGGGIDNDSGFDFQGGGVVQANGMNGGPVIINYLSPSSTKRAVAFKNCSFTHGGGRVNTANVGIGIDNLNGLALLSNCRSDANQTDAFNFHTHLSTFYSSGKRMHVLTVNCSGYDNGRDQNASCQGLTTHNSVISIDIGGDYQKNKGGNVRNIDDTKSMLIGTYCEGDKGYPLFHPCGIHIDNNAQMWAYRVKVDQPASTYAYRVVNSAKLYRRECYPTGQPDAGDGQFLTY